MSKLLILDGCRHKELFCKMLAEGLLIVFLKARKIKLRNSSKRVGNREVVRSSSGGRIAVGGHLGLE